MKLLHKTLPLLVGLSFINAENSFGSDNEKAEPPKTLAVSGDYIQLKTQSDKLRAELVKTQLLLADMLRRQDLLSTQIATSPIVIEKEAAKRVARAIFVDPPLPGENDKGDDESGPPLNHEFNYVENLLSELKHTQHLAFQPFLETEQAAQYNARINDLERHLGIAQARTEEERKKREEERLRMEEELRRRQMEIEGLTQQLSSANTRLEEAQKVHERQIAWIKELGEENEQLARNLEGRTETSSNTAYNYGQ